MSYFINYSPRCPQAAFPPLFKKLLFIYKSKIECFSGLKCQYIIARGIVSGGKIRNAAPGKRCRRKTVREDSINKANNSFRTELPDTIFGKHKIISLVRRKILFFINVVARTISLPAFQPRASLHLPWARLS